jgi:hypothetical protein
MVFIKPILLDTLPLPANNSIIYVDRSGNGNFKLQSRKQKRASIIVSLGKYLPIPYSSSPNKTVSIGTARKPPLDFEVIFCDLILQFRIILTSPMDEKEYLIAVDDKFDLIHSGKFERLLI